MYKGLNIYKAIDYGNIKMESIRKLRNFNLTETLYQNNLKHMAFFFTFFKGYGCN